MTNSPFPPGSALDAKKRLSAPDFRSRQLAVRGLVRSVRAVKIKGVGIEGEMVVRLPGAELEATIRLVVRAG